MNVGQIEDIQPTDYHMLWLPVEDRLGALFRRGLQRVSPRISHIFPISVLRDSAASICGEEQQGMRRFVYAFKQFISLTRNDDVRGSSKLEIEMDAFDGVLAFVLHDIHGKESFTQ